MWWRKFKRSYPPYIDEYHDILPLPGEKHATLFILYECWQWTSYPEIRRYVYYPEIKYIRGTWRSGWEFPRKYLNKNIRVKL